MKDELILKLETYMAKHNLKAYQLANKLETTSTNISRWLTGKNKISSAWRQLIQQKLNLD
jgi:hypothetical protein